MENYENVLVDIKSKDEYESIKKVSYNIDKQIQKSSQLNEVRQNQLNLFHQRQQILVNSEFELEEQNKKVQALVEKN